MSVTKYFQAAPAALEAVAALPDLSPEAITALLAAGALVPRAC